MSSLDKIDELPVHPEVSLVNMDTSIKSVSVKLDKFTRIPVASRPRGYAPVEVHHDIDAVRIMAVPNAPSAVLTINQAFLQSGEESDPIPLKIGRNLIDLGVIAPDGKTKKVEVLKIFRRHPTPSWKRIEESAPWAARDCAGELVFHGKMWLFGGFTPPLISDVWCSSDGIHWTKTGTIPSSNGIDIPIALVFENKMWVTDVDATLYASQDGKTWSVVTTQAPWKGRNGMGGVVFNGKIFVMGGMKEGEPFNDVWSSTDGVHWIEETRHAPWSKRQIHHSPLILNNKIWLLGGGILGSTYRPTYHPFVAYNDVWNSSDGRQWERVTEHAPWPSRIWGSSVVYRNRLWVMGGFRSEPVWENFGDIWYSADGESWNRLETPPKGRHSGIEPEKNFGETWYSANGGSEINNSAIATLSDSIWKPRHEMSVYAFDDKLWLMGGMVWPLMNDVWNLQIDKLSFVTQPVTEGFSNSWYTYKSQADFNQSGEKVQYRLLEGPEWLSIHPSTGIVCGTLPAVTDRRIVIEAYDNRGETARQDYILHVLNP